MHLNVWFSRFETLWGKSPLWEVQLFVWIVCAWVTVLSFDHESDTRSLQDPPFIDYTAVAIARLKIQLVTEMLFKMALLLIAFHSRSPDDIFYLSYWVLHPSHTAAINYLLGHFNFSDFKNLVTPL